MAFVIRSKDGRTTICTASADAVVEHVTRLRQAGSEVEITDFNGKQYGLTGLHGRADALKKARAKILQAT